jgi:PTH2 family peptidyl-tRNA hydrolase
MASTQEGGSGGAPSGGNQNPNPVEGETPSTASSSVPAAVTSLVELGFDQKVASDALAQFSGNVERAAEFLLNGGVPSPAPPQNAFSAPGAGGFSFNPPQSGAASSTTDSSSGSTTAAPPAPTAPVEFPPLDPDEPLKMVLVVRTDLGMSAGKMCAQCAHAAVDLCLEIDRGRGRSPHIKTYQTWMYQWYSEGCAKIALAAPNLQTIVDLEAKAKAAGLPCVIIRDAGRTQIAAGSQTVLGIGPAPNRFINPVTGKLSLL